MKFNKQFFKRWSTVANLSAMVAGAIIAGIPTLGLSVQHAGVAMMAMNIIIAVCQVVKQKAETNVIED